MYRVHFLGLCCLVVFIRRHGSLNKERVSFKPQNYMGNFSNISIRFVSWIPALVFESIKHIICL